MHENKLTDKANDYVATIVPPAETRTQDKLVNSIFALRTEFDPTAIDRLATLTEEQIVSYLLQGYSYKGTYFHFSPTIHGPWTGLTSNFDPAIHKIGIKVTPTAALRSLLAQARVNVLGEKHDSAVIGTITDLHTGEMDTRLTPGKPVRIDGKNIRILPENDPDCGVFFVSTVSSASTKATARLYTNNPSALEVEIPALSDDHYHIKIVTKYSAGGALLAHPRVIEFEQDLIVGTGEFGK